jgi:hypothetical protein
MARFRRRQYEVSHPNGKGGRVYTGKAQAKRKAKFWGSGSKVHRIRVKKYW